MSKGERLARNVFLTMVFVYAALCAAAMYFITGSWYATGFIFITHATIPWALLLFGFATDYLIE